MSSCWAADHLPVTVAETAGGHAVIGAGGSIELIGDWQPGDPLYRGPRRRREPSRCRSTASASAIASAMAASTLDRQGADPARGRARQADAGEAAARHLAVPAVADAGPAGLARGAKGEEVKAGQELAVVEAMKMENVLRAERDGKVAQAPCRSPATASRSTRRSSNSNDGARLRRCASAARSRASGIAPGRWSRRSSAACAAGCATATTAASRRFFAGEPAAIEEMIAALPQGPAPWPGSTASPANPRPRNRRPVSSSGRRRENRASGVRRAVPRRPLLARHHLSTSVFAFLPTR